MAINNSPDINSERDILEEHTDKLDTKYEHII